MKRPRTNGAGWFSWFTKPEYYQGAYAGPGWRGSVVWNDNHVTYENTSVLQTRYGSAPHHPPHAVNKHDQLFQVAGDSDALMIHNGN